MSWRLAVQGKEEVRLMAGPNPIETDPYFRHKHSFHFRDYRQLEEFFRAVSEFKGISTTFLSGEW